MQPLNDVLQDVSRGTFIWSECVLTQLHNVLLHNAKEDNSPLTFPTQKNYLEKVWNFVLWEK